MQHSAPRIIQTRYPVKTSSKIDKEHEAAEPPRGFHTSPEWVPGLRMEPEAKGRESIPTMCGHFTQQLTWRQIHELYRMPDPEPSLNLQLHYNGAPTQDFPACQLDEDGNCAIAKLRWGLIPFWAKDSKVESRPLNARAKSVHYKPSFGTAFRFRRCLVPANGWSEWQRAGHGK